MGKTDKTLQIFLKLRDQATKPLGRINKALGRFGGAGKVAIQGATAALKLFDRAARGVLGTVVDLSTKAVLSIGAVGTAIAALSVKAAADTEKSAARIKTLSGARGLTKEGLQSSLAGIAARTGQGFEGVASSGFDIFSAVATDEDALRILEIAARGATGTFSNLQDVTGGLATALNAFGKGAEEAEAFLTVMQAAADRGKTDFGELGSAIGQVAAQGALLGVSFEDTLGILTQLTTTSETTSQAATQLSSIFAGIQKKAGELGKELDLTLISKDPARFFEELTRVSEETGKSFIKLFGRQEAADGIANLVANVDKLKSVLESTRSPIVSLGELFDEAVKTVSVKFAQLRGTIFSILSDIGTAMGPIVADGIQAITDLLNDQRGTLDEFAKTINRYSMAIRDLVGDLAVAVKSSDLFARGFVEGIQSVARLGLEALISAIRHFGPSLIDAYLEAGRFAGTAFVDGLRAVFTGSDNILPIDDAISNARGKLKELQDEQDRAIRRQNRGNTPSSNFGTLQYTNVGAIAEQRGLIADLEKLKEMGKTTDRLKNSVGLLSQATESMKLVLDSAANSAQGFSNEAASAIKSTFGEGTFEELKNAIDRYHQKIQETPDVFEDSAVGFNRKFASPVLTGYDKLIKAANDYARAQGKTLTGTGDPGRRILGAAELEVFKSPLKNADSNYSAVLKAGQDAAKKSAVALTEIGRDVAATLSGAFVGVFDGFIDGTLNARDALRELALDLTRLTLQIATQKTIENALVQIPFFANANGNVIRGGFKAFANGGVVNTPTLGLVGEGQYNEAIVPLPDGRRIPVQLSGGGGGGATNIVFNVNANDSKSFLDQIMQGEVRRGIESIYIGARGSRRGFNR